MGEKKYLSFDVIEVEITRRCNLQCRHCFRGDAQDLDLSNEDIDAFLGQTEIINQLYFTGGEPTLCIEKMRYFLQGLKENNIFLGFLYIATNGVIQSMDFVNLIKDYSDYIMQYMPEDEDKRQFIKLCISQDQYHVGYDSLDSYYYYKVKLHNIADVCLLRNGICPTKLGRAKNLREAIEGYDKHMVNHQRIEILSKDSEVVCPSAYQYKLYYPEQIFIPCGLHITAKGEIANMKFSTAFGAYDKIDENTICHVSDNIYEKILKYNCGLSSCNLCSFKEQNERNKDCQLWVMRNFLTKGSREKLNNLLQKHAEMQVVSKFATKPDVIMYAFDGEKELVDNLQKIYDEKEELFEKVMCGEYDIETPYVRDLDLILKHLRN